MLAEPDQIRIDERTLPAGALITIDGSTGEIFAEEVAGSSVIAPEAAILLGWARELGIEIGEEAAPAAGEEAATGDAEAPNAGTTPATAGATGSRAATTDDILRALLIKGMTTPAPLAVAAGCAPAGVGPFIEQLVAGGLVEAVGDAYRLTGEGKLRALAIVIIFNEHTHGAYDAAVLERLAALHGDAAAWLSALAAGLPRLEGYQARLEQALALARDGDARYGASPRVDSYHGAWFELHEDLIRLAGRTRAEEAAAGRA